MFLKLVVIFGVLFQLTQGASLLKKNDDVTEKKSSNGQQTGQEESATISSADELSELEKLLVRELLENAALRNKLKYFYDNDNNDMEQSNDAVDGDNENDDDDSDEVEKRGGLDKRGAMVKRFPKWRSGDTRSRVRLLHQQHNSQSDHGDGRARQHNSNDEYSPLLRNKWENNMLERNRMYQNLLLG